MSQSDLSHHRFRRVDEAIFTRTVVQDCMEHRCAMAATGKQKLDACCQHGVDVDLRERDAIAARDGELRALLRGDAATMPWFHDAIERDADMPSGAYVRTRVVDGGCVFLSHDRRGCAIHRSAVERGWDYRSAKPHVCRLFPLTYTNDAIVISGDYEDYSCAFVAGAPSLYRVTRDALGDVFGAELVAALDDVERAVLARRLPIA
jgi:Fe-S-cluster containining protein